METPITCHLKQNNFQAQIWNSLREFRNSKDFVDVEIFCNDGSSMAHKIVLAAYSPFLYSAIKQIQDTKNDKATFKFNLNLKTMEYLLKFIYEGEVLLDINEINDFLKAGKNLQIYGFPHDKDESIIENDERAGDQTKNLDKSPENLKIRLDQLSIEENMEEENQPIILEDTFESNDSDGDQRCEDDVENLGSFESISPLSPQFSRFVWSKSPAKGMFL